MREFISIKGMSKEEIVKLCARMKDGDEEAFDLLYWNAYKLLMFMANKHGLEELTFGLDLELVNIITLFDPTRGSLSTYIRRILQNRLYINSGLRILKNKRDARRKRIRNQFDKRNLIVFVDRALDKEGDDDGYVGMSLDIETMHKAIDDLDESSRAILVDRYFNEHTLYYLADKYHVSHETINNVCKRAIRSLRIKMAAER